MAVTKKQKAFHGHVKKRAKDRLGLILTDEKIKLIVNDIQSKNSKLVGGEGSRTHHKVNLDNTTLIVVYSKKYKTIVTVLPDEDFKEFMEQI